MCSHASMPPNRTLPVPAVAGCPATPAPFLENRGALRTLGQAPTQSNAGTRGGGWAPRITASHVGKANPAAASAACDWSTPRRVGPTGSPAPSLATTSAAKRGSWRRAVAVAAVAEACSRLMHIQAPQARA